MNTLLFISGQEIFIVFLGVLLLFGAKKIPELARGLGKGMKEFKKATSDIKREIEEAELSEDIKDIKKNVDNINPAKDLTNGINEIKNNLKG